jgi:peptide/nickel transport system permease protein
MASEALRAWRRVRSSPLALVGLGIVAVMTLVALAAPLIAPHDPVALDILVRLSPPSLDHLFGTDEVGRDIFSRVVVGARTSMLTAVAVVAAAATLGGLLGAYSGLAGG